MDDLKCLCNKIVCQIEDNVIIIKCRHCKRLVIIKTQGVTTVEYK